MPIANPITHPSIHHQRHLPAVHNLCIFSSIYASAIHSSTYLCIYPSTHYLLTVIPSTCISVCPLIQASFYTPVDPFAHLSVICSSSVHLPTIHHSSLELLDHLSINLTPPTRPLIYSLFLLYLFFLFIYLSCCLFARSSIYPLFTILHLAVPPFAQICVHGPPFHSPSTC